MDSESELNSLSIDARYYGFFRLKDIGIFSSIEEYCNSKIKNEIVGGHLSLWNSGLLLYQLVIAGFDCKDAIVKKYGYNISIIVKKNEIDIKNKLVYDNGDISTIKPYLPKQIKYDTNFKDISFCGDIENIGWWKYIDKIVLNIMQSYKIEEIN